MTSSHAITCYGNTTSFGTFVPNCTLCLVGYTVHSYGTFLSRYGSSGGVTTSTVKNRGIASTGRVAHARYELSLTVTGNAIHRAVICGTVTQAVKRGTMTLACSYFCHGSLS